MKRSWFNSRELLVVLGGFSFYVFFLFLSLSSWGFLSESVLSSFSFYAQIDDVSVYLTVLTLFVSLVVLSCKSWLSTMELSGVFISQLFALVSYIANNSLVFWFSYELSMFVILFLIIGCSPYSERYLAFWFFLGYWLCSGVPLLVIVLVLSDRFGDFSFLCWEFEEGDLFLILLLFVIFISKVPLFPFYGWLPVVHAEASSIVSVCLSGYVMKLGILGLVRFCSKVLPFNLFLDGYVAILLFLAILYFCVSVLETDNKRWLAYLSLAHISVVPVCLKVGVLDTVNFSYSYCVGHALSASLGFMSFWFVSAISGCRNWFFMKGCLNSSNSLFFSLLLCFCFCGSLPLTLQFFCELWVISCGFMFNTILVGLFSIYLFFSGLVPMTCLGYILCRFQDAKPVYSGLTGCGLVLIFLVVLNVLVFVFI